ncbi:carbonate dehydratase [soil metagenome]
MAEAYLNLLEGNLNWMEKMRKEDPKFFERLSVGQNPEYLWIGCSDSRVHANEITGTQAGTIFVHRNLANVVIQTDMNLLTVLYFAVDILKVKHVIICGHYGCSGIAAAMDNADHGFVNNWLRQIKEVYASNKKELERINDEERKYDRLVELNVIQQVQNLSKTRIVQRAWKNGLLAIHGWVFDCKTGLINDLNCDINNIEQVEPIFRLNL